MGTFDYRCVATNLPLGGKKAVFVAVMETEPSKWTPVSLPFAGAYDSYGRIDGFTPDFRSTVLANGLEEAARAGRVEAANEARHALSTSRPLTPTGVVSVIERATTMSEWEGETPGLRVDGRRLRHVYFKKEVFDALVRDTGGAPKKEPTPEETKQLISRAYVDPFGAWVHRDLHKVLGETRRKVVGAVNELLAVAEWMRANGLEWKNASTGQFSSADTFVALLEARRRFAQDQVLKPVLAKEAVALEDDVAEEASYDPDAPELPERWVREAEVSWYGLRFGDVRVAAMTTAALREAVMREAQGTLKEDDVAEVFVVDRGLATQRQPLRPLLEKAGGGDLAPLWDAVEQSLPALSAPVARQDRLPHAEQQPWGFTLEVYDVGSE